MRLTPDMCQRATRARDARFDGVFFVGITTTRVYCRPVCPSRMANPDHRRFFDSAAAAERAGFRPCLRCRPELAPGRAVADFVPRLARQAAVRIAAGALNGRSLAQLANDLGVSGRHVRRALEREIGVSPIALAETHRLLLAKRLLTDTDLPVTRIAFASGFQSVRRFNSLFRERYRLTPSVMRPRPRGARPETDVIRLTLAYRAPLDWDALVTLLGRSALPGVELAQGGRYARTIEIDGHSGVVFVEDGQRHDGGSVTAAHLNVAISPSLLPVLMPLLARLRHLFDLDAESAVINAHLTEGGLGALVSLGSGVRVPGALDGFEAALGALLACGNRCGGLSQGCARRVVAALGLPVETGIPALSHLAPSAERVAQEGPASLVALGVAPRRARALATVARAVVNRTLCLEPGGDVVAARRELLRIDGISDRCATGIVTRALYWPDAFPASDPVLQRAAGVPTARALRARAERWRPWRAYAALHLGMAGAPP